MPDEAQPSSPGGCAPPDPGVNARRALERCVLTVCSAVYAGARLSIGHLPDRLVWQPAAEPAPLRPGTGA